MQNVVLQTAKTAPAKQAANQSNMAANLGAENNVNSAPNAFAELLKKQVKQQKADASETTDGAKPADAAAATQTKPTDEIAVTDSTAAGDAVQTLKPDTDEKSAEALPPIQDLLLMQIGLQSAPQVATAQAATTDNSTLAGDTAVLGEQAGVSAKTALPCSGTDAKSAQVTDAALDDADGTGKQAAELLPEDAPKLANAEQGISKTLVRDKDFKEIELKTAAVQPGNMAPAPSKLPDNVVTSMVAASQIPTPFGKPEWNQAVNQRVMWMVSGGEQSATLTLNPPDLGPLQVVIQVDNDQVDTTFISDNPEVRQALQDGMNMLRDKMQDSGMQLGNAQVSSQAQSQRHFEQAMQQRAQQRLEQATQAGNTAAEPVSSNVVVQRVSNGLVDTFA